MKRTSNLLRHVKLENIQILQKLGFHLLIYMISITTTREIDYTIESNSALKDTNPERYRTFKKGDPRFSALVFGTL